MLRVRRLQVVILAVVLLLLVLLVLHPDETAELLPTALPLLLITAFVSQPLAVDPVPVLTTELPDDELLTEMIDCGRFELFDSGSVPMKEFRSFGVLPNIEILIDRSLI